MYSWLMSDCAERAVSELCDGAATAASGSAADTVTVSEMFATVSRIEISCDPAFDHDAALLDEIEAGDGHLDRVGARRQVR